jgi:cytidylate kinase
MVITIGRECGCDADEIGIMLGQKLNIPCYNRNSLLELARKEGVYEKYPYFFSEVSQDELDSSVGYEHRREPQKAMSGIIKDRDCIVVGRCGNYALRDREDMVSIFLTGDKNQRIANMAAKREISTKKARDIVERTDSRRREYQKFYTGEDWGSAKHYHMCIDVTKLGTDGTVAMIENLLRQLRMI